MSSPTIVGDSEPEAVTFRLPDGPKTPKLLNGALFIASRKRFFQGLQRRYGDAFTVQLPIFGTTVVVAEPSLLKQVFTAKPDVLHGGKSALGVMLGPGSLFSLDEGEHLAERRLLLQPFHGDRMRSYEALITEETLRAIASWPEGVEFATVETFNTITLRVILRAVFGAEGEAFEELEGMLGELTALGQKLVLAPSLKADLGRWSPGGRLEAGKQRYRAIVDDLIVGHLADPDLDERTDILALMLRSMRDSGNKINRGHIADELQTILVAGHETTASALAWAIERISRHPDILHRLEEEAGGTEATLRIATINEVLRNRPVIDITGRWVQKPFKLGDWHLPPGSVVMPGISVTHDDDRFHTEADRFDPDRYVGRKPETYAWVAFGGGMRRCLGAAFALFEMDIVLRTILQQFAVQPTHAGPERSGFKGVAYAPAKGGLVTVRRRKTPLGGDSVAGGASAGSEGAAAGCPVDHVGATTAAE